MTLPAKPVTIATMVPSHRIAYPALALGALTFVAAARPAKEPAAVPPGFAVRYRNVISPDRVRALTVLPGETVTLEVVDRNPGSGYVARPAAGRLVPLGTGRWAWTAPPAPGLYPIQVVAPDGGDSVTLQAFVVVPYDRLRGRTPERLSDRPLPRETTPGSRRPGSSRSRGRTKTSWSPPTSGSSSSYASSRPAPGSTSC